MPHQMLQLKDQEITMLRDEMEILMNERQMLLRIAGSAATLIAELDEKTLPPATYEAAEYLGEYLNELPEESMSDALEAVHAHVISDSSTAA